MIHFFNQEINYQVKKESLIRVWLVEIIKSENWKLEEINVIFCSDVFLLKMNQKYLQHNTYTDIITFDTTEKGFIEGELYISIDRVRKNAKFNKTTFINELCRVLCHGCLHLVGYKDKKPLEALIMRRKEDYYLSLLKF